MTEEPRATLLPCPFCGAAPEWNLGQKGDGTPWRYLACSDCEAMGPHTSIGGDETAIAMWNRRATPAVRDGLVGRLLAKADEYDEARGFGAPSGSLMREAAAAIETWEWAARAKDKQILEFSDALSLRPETRVKELPTEPPIEAMQHGLNLLLIAQVIERGHWSSLIPEVAVRQLQAADAYIQSTRPPSGAPPDLQGTSEPYTPEEAARLLAKCEEAAAALKVASTLEITEEAVEAAIDAANGVLTTTKIDPIPVQNEHLEFPPKLTKRIFRAALEASLPFLSQTGGEKSDA